MPIVVQAGASARAVTSAAEVDLLSIDGGSTFPTAGVALVNADRWTLQVETDQDVTVRVYTAAGPNAGLTIVSGYTTVVTSSAPLVLSVDGESAQRLRVTAQASSTTAAVSADLRAVTR